jgi:hypothetical protein
VFRNAIPCALALGAAIVNSGSLHSQQSAGNPGPLRVQRAEIMDRRGFERPMVAYTMFVPVGWRGVGEVEYSQNACLPSQRINWTATASDGIGSIQIIPEEKWSASTMQQQDGCFHAPIQGARQYLESWVQRNRPGARILDFRPRPDLAEPFQKIAQQGNGMRSWGDAGEVLIAYQLRGRPVRESISSASFYIHTQMPGFEFLQGVSAPGFAMRAPEGALDFKAVEALRQSIRSAPEWQTRMNQVMAERNRIAIDHNRRMGEINRQGAADRSAIIANTAREVNEIQMGTWQSRNESMDRTQRETIESIRGVETYNDPHYGGTVQLSNQFQHAWQLRDGSYVLTDDPNFDPARLNLQGTRLRVAQ